ncbi:BTB/POZ domain-containing protein KCTD3-like [Symsagittifera roscoffensis]|uniref:BTB/POZ domain-containing protein KCTD3-like n=1 Tax=Symsagittifera roscoffensis TaxID=84072 RepID=UPI00307C0A6F
MANVKETKSAETQTSSDGSLITELELSKIVRLNVGGKLFVTSAQTLRNTKTDSFLSRIISDGLPSTRDENGAIFVDRCPILFEKILAFLRTKRIRLNGVDIDDMLNEADFYGVQPLMDRLKVCKQLKSSTCGNLAFCGIIPPMENNFPINDWTDTEDLAPRSRNEEVLALCATDKWIAVAYASKIACYSTRQFSGEACPNNTFVTWLQPIPDGKPSFLALKSLKQSSREERSEQLIVACVTNQWDLLIWKQSVDLDSTQISPVSFVGKFSLFPNVTALVFAGRRQVVTLNNEGSFAVWHYSRDFQQQKVEPISSFDECGPMMFFGHKNGIIRYFNAETLPVRLEDNKIILTDLYHDQENDAITALNVRLATSNNVIDLGAMENQFYFEIAYGTASGRVKLISEHAETIGQGPQLLFSFAVHRSPVIKILLAENHLISNCADFNHVRCWQVSRFRGLLSKNPLPMPLTSFKMLHLEPNFSSHDYVAANPIGPHMLSGSQVWYLQKITPEATEMFVISAMTGECVHKIESVDSSPINCFSITEEWRRVGDPTQYVFTGHKNGTIQVWNLAAMRPNTSHNNVHNPIGDPYSLVSSNLNSQLNYNRESMINCTGDMQHQVRAIKNPRSFYPTVPNELYPQRTNHPTIDDILKMLDNYDLSQEEP